MNGLNNFLIVSNYQKIKLKLFVIRLVECMNFMLLIIKFNLIFSLI